MAVVLEEIQTLRTQMVSTSGELFAHHPGSVTKTQINNKGDFECLN